MGKTGILAAILFCVLFCRGCECLKIDDRAEYGYPTGLMSVCPGSSKPAEISRSQLKYLLFGLEAAGWRRKTYNYWSAKNMATDPRLDFSRKTLVFVTGYLDSTNFVIPRMFSGLYQELGYNVILVDYQRFATVHYYLASRLTRPVGKHVGEILAQLTSSGLDPSKVELLGFSLGGHVVSYIAKSYQNITGTKLSRITSLEPSGPCFRHLKPDERLNLSDAEYVEVLHTNIDGYGMAPTMGHVDYYINGGEYQPSDIHLFPCTSTCSHFRVLGLWVSAVKNPKKFIGMKCDSVQQARDFSCYDRLPRETITMGLNADRKKKGIYFVSTGLWYPFYLGQKGLDEEYASWRTITHINDGNDTVIYV